MLGLCGAWLGPIMMKRGTRFLIKQLTTVMCRMPFVFGRPCIIQLFCSMPLQALACGVVHNIV